MYVENNFVCSNLKCHLLVDPVCPGHNICFLLHLLQLLTWIINTGVNGTINFVIRLSLYLYFKFVHIKIVFQDYVNHVVMGLWIFYCESHYGKADCTPHSTGPLIAHRSQLVPWLHITVNWSPDCISQSTGPLIEHRSQLVPWLHTAVKWSPDCTLQSTGPLIEHCSQLVPWSHNIVVEINWNNVS